MTRSTTFRLCAAIVTVCTAAPVAAVTPPAVGLDSSAALALFNSDQTTLNSYTTVNLPSSEAVTADYKARANGLIWTRDATLEAARALVPILRRARLDGLHNGPELANILEQALARTPSSSPTELLQFDQLISAMWVLYVEALRAPDPDMIYGDPTLAPKRPNTRVTLAGAYNAPLLLHHVQATAAVNPIYAGLRDAAWAQLKLIEGALPDARTMSNLKRARLLPATGRYIIVDAATAQLSMYKDDKVEDSMKVVVGKRSSPTPLLVGTIHYVTFNPYWNIPTDVTARGVAPIVLKRGTKYLKLARYEVASDFTDGATVVSPDDIDWESVAAGETKIRVRQLPGPRNMMGAMKFGFINDQGIYLHDTPEMDLFAKERRTFSLGCVRVEDARRLARWLLNREPAPPNDQPEQHVRLDAGVPIFITYLTMQAHAGQLTFADDVYGLDAVSMSAAGEQARAPVSVAAPGVAADRQ